MVIYNSSKYGIEADVRTLVTPAIVDELKEREIGSIILNYARGWIGSDVDFLGKIETLKSVNIIATRACSVAGVTSLPDLVHISISSYNFVPIDFRVFRSLRSLVTFARPGVKTAYGIKSLEDLVVYESKIEELEGIEEAKGLRSLTIGSTPFGSLKVLSSMTKLESLEVFYSRRLKTLEGISHLDCLTQLDVTGCPCGATLNEVKLPANLEWLTIKSVGGIQSLGFIDQLPKVDYLNFDGTSNILDGDLSRLLRFPKRGLRKGAWFKNRRHYSHKEKDFQ